MEPFSFPFSKQQLTGNEKYWIGSKDIFAPEELLSSLTSFPIETIKEKEPGRKKEKEREIRSQKSPSNKKNQSKKTTIPTASNTNFRETQLFPKVGRTKPCVTFESLSLQKSPGNKRHQTTKTKTKSKTKATNQIQKTDSVDTKGQKHFEGSLSFDSDLSFYDLKGDPFPFSLPLSLPLSASFLRETRSNRREEEKEGQKKISEKAKTSDKDERLKNVNSYYSLVSKKENKTKNHKKESNSNAKDFPVILSTASDGENATDLKGQIECKFWNIQKVDKFCFLNVELERYLLFPPREIIFDESLTNIRKHCDLKFTEDFLNQIRTQTLIPSSILKNAASLDRLRATKPQRWHKETSQTKREREREREREEAKRIPQQKSYHDSLLGQGSFGYVYSVGYQHPETAWSAGKIRWKPKSASIREDSSDEEEPLESKRRKEKEKEKDKEEAILKVLKKKKKEATAAVHPFLTEGLIGFVTNAVCPRTTIEFLDVARSATKPFRIGFVMEKYPSTLKHFWLHNPASGDPEQTFLVLHHISSHLLSLQNSLRFVHGDLRSDNTVYRSVQSPTILNPQETKNHHILSFWDVRLIDLGRAAIFWRNKTWNTWDLVNKHKTFENFNFDLAVFCSDLYLHILGFHPTMIRFERQEKGFCKKIYDKFSYLLPFLKYVLEGVDYVHAAQEMKTMDPVPYVLQQVRERDQSMAFRSHPKLFRDLVLGHLETIRKRKN